MVTELPDRFTPADAVLNLSGDILGILTRYGGKTIHAGPDMDALIEELVTLTRSERTRAFVDKAAEA